ncbi:MAG: TetR/AcrR family transcriptional regulator, partial [Pseudomonadota bacterium]
ARLNAHLATDIANRPDAIIADFLEIFVILWDFRYLLRDPLAALNDDDTVRVRLRETLQVIEESAEARILKSAQAGYIDLKNADVRSLAVSCTLIGRYWFDYARVRYSDDTHPLNLRLGCTEQMLAVLQPYFTKTAHELIATFKSEQLGTA